MSRTGGPSEVFVILCCGGTGSRLLVRLLAGNGLFMGRDRGPVGEDERLFGGMLWDPVVRGLFVVAAKYPDDPRNAATLRLRIDATHERFLGELPTDPAPPAVGIKAALLFPYFARQYQQVLAERGTTLRVIHLTRDVYSWMLSGRESHSRGVARPSRHYALSMLGEPFNRLVWFGDLADELVFGEHRIPLDSNRVYTEEEQIILESFLWRTTNTVCASFGDLGPHYMRIRYEDLVEHTDLSLGRVAEFLSVELTCPSGMEIDPSRLTVDAHALLGHAACGHIGTICGDLMTQLGY